MLIIDYFIIQYININIENQKNYKNLPLSKFSDCSKYLVVKYLNICRNDNLSEGILLYQSVLYFNKFLTLCDSVEDEEIDWDTYKLLI